MKKNVSYRHLYMCNENVKIDVHNIICHFMRNFVNCYALRYHYFTLKLKKLLKDGVFCPRFLK